MDAQIANGMAFRSCGSRRLLRNHASLVVLFQLLLDSLLVIGLLWGLSEWRNGEFEHRYRVFGVLALLLMWSVFRYQGVYSRFSSIGRLMVRLAVAWGLVLCLLLLVAFVTKSSEDYSRLALGIWAVGCYAGQVLIHTALYRTVIAYQRSFTDRFPVLVVGTHQVAVHLVHQLNTNAWLPDRVVGVVDDTDQVNLKWHNPDSPCLGGIEKLPALIREHGIRRVYIALSIQYSNRIDLIYDGLSRLGVDVVWVPDIFSMNLLNHSVREVGGLALISLSESPMMSGGRAFIKNILDTVLALISITLFSPVLLAAALAIKLESPGPVVFKQQRHGWDGNVIKIWKFRSMYVDQPKADQLQQATRDDPRITRVGRFIRRTSIDELPQLFNVLQGRMSMVGPRPHAVQHNEEYSEKIDAYLLRHRIKPGITGLAQVNGYRGETDTLDKMEKRVEYDLAYINNWSIWLDITILAKTPFSLFSKNIY